MSAFSSPPPSVISSVLLDFPHNKYVSFHLKCPTPPECYPVMKRDSRTAPRTRSTDRKHRFPANKWIILLLNSCNTKPRADHHSHNHTIHPIYGLVLRLVQSLCRMKCTAVNLKLETPSNISHILIPTTGINTKADLNSDHTIIQST